MRFVSRRIVLLALIVAFVSIHRPAAAVTLRIDYSKDSNNFFPAGSQARAAMDAAAAFYSDILEDTLSAIETPPEKFLGSLGGEVTWHWRRSYLNPSGGGTIFETDVDEGVDIDMDADEFLVFVGAKTLAEGELGVGGAGGWLWTNPDNGKFTADEQSEWEDIDSDFRASIERRQESSGAASWGGALSFDIDTTWHFNHTTNPGAGTTDFYSVALHELAHVLGFGAVDDNDSKDTLWEARVNGTNFTGTNSNSHYTPSEQVPLASEDDVSHWFGDDDGDAEDENVMSVEYGGTTVQTALMVPDLPLAVRRRLTDLDAAALVDIGWSIDLPNAAASATMLASVTDGGGSEHFAALSASVVSARSVGASTVPEPSAMVLGGLAALFVLVRQRSAARRG